MKNEVYGLNSTKISKDGEILKSGTLLFPTLQDAERFLDYFNKLDDAKTNLREQVTSKYSYDKSYIVDSSTAEYVHSKKSFYVSKINAHLLQTGITDTNDTVDVIEDYLSNSDDGS